MIYYIFGTITCLLVSVVIGEGIVIHKMKKQMDEVYTDLYKQQLWKFRQKKSKGGKK